VEPAQASSSTPGKTQAQIAGDAWLDECYVSRLLSGERNNPSRDALLLLASWGLGLAVEETDELLMAAHYKPLILPSRSLAPLGELAGWCGRRASGRVKCSSK